MSLLSGWRLALRLAWREVRRSRARSALVLVMVTFPVIAVVAADVAQATSSVSSVEGLDRRLGHAEARVQLLPGVSSVHQTADPDSGGVATRDQHGAKGPATLAGVRAALGGIRPMTELRLRQVGIRTEVGVLQADATGLDPHSPLTAGLFRLTSGRLPSAADEVDVNAALAGHGYAVGDRVTLTGGQSLTVVGTAESADQRTQPIIVGTVDSTLVHVGGPGAGVRTWLFGGPPVTWAQVRAVNAVGGVVLSRQVIEHPPATSQLAPEFRGYTGDSSQLYAVLALIGVMALLEVVLLAGPAFAVGARRQSRALALIAANGGNPSQARRVILGSAVVLGTIGAVVGTVLGIGLARLLLPVLQGMQGTWFGPFQVRWTHLAGIAAFGFLSSFLAAVVPAWIASRQDVVAVLAGRRGDRAASRRSPFVGVVLLALGVLGAVLGSRQGSGEFLIAGAAVVSVFGMIFLVPVVVTAVARLGRGLPLPLRYAVRDAARHRTRTVPAVAAVAATVAGVVALSIANSSDQAQAKAEYQPLMPVGLSAIDLSPRTPDWPAVRAAVGRIAPAAGIEDVTGVDSASRVSLQIPGNGAVQANWHSTFPSTVLVAGSTDGAVGALLSPALDSAGLTQVDHALRAGRAVVFVQDAEPVHTLVLRLGPGHATTVPATYVGVGSVSTPSQAVLPPSVARRAGLSPRPVGLLLDGTPLTGAQESTLREALTGLDPTSYLYVERGYQVPGSEQVVLWILFGLGGVLMLGGTLTATFLALSDARPDLATLSAVGASPRTRRGVAAAYAVAVGLVGAVLGAGVGFIPGIAVTYPLTRNFTGEPGPSHYLDIPWLLIGALVLALPVLTAAVVGLVARSRLPVVARLE
ncbi:FtsX-like permease family protein [Nocardioides cynanchi]|uniref:FtsX-like permease family protein n=1 Tax=Nocardioides cynanchi TaxID=2558918 RepID=UPI001244B0E0|nr:ABC transporter permease [Nocardioides cynanchi]